MNVGQLVEHVDVLCLVHFSSDGVRLCPLGTSATIWPIVPAPDDDDDDDECAVVGGMRETEVFAENMPQRRIVHHKSYMASLGLEPGQPRWEALTHLRFPYGY
jgi:hypothetical protein